MNNTMCRRTLVLSSLYQILQLHEYLATSDDRAQGLDLRPDFSTCIMRMALRLGHNASCMGWQQQCSINLTCIQRS